MMAAVVDEALVVVQGVGYRQEFASWAMRTVQSVLDGVKSLGNDEFHRHSRRRSRSRRTMLNGRLIER